MFAVGLVFYEMVTRVLPRWPFRWPFERHEVFERKAPPELLRITRRAASFDLQHRYADAGAMLAALRAALPDLDRGRDDAQRVPARRPLGWRAYRMQEFAKRFERRLRLDYRCHRCSGASPTTRLSSGPYRA